MLQALGASAAEDCVYRHVVTALSATEEEIAAATALPSDEVRAAVAGLEERGLASLTSDRPRRVVAASPGAVESMISDRLGELRAAQDTLDRVAAQYRANSLARGAEGVFEIVRGVEALRQCSLQLLRSARFDALNLVKPPIIALHSNERAWPSDAVHGRVVFETAALDNDGALDALSNELRSQDEIRVHTKLPIKILVVDRSVALVPLAQQDTTPLGVLVRKGAVLDAFLALFDYVWATAVPLHVDNANSPVPSRGSPLSDEDRRLLSLLLAGLTDEAIATHAGVSVRTVQRKVQALMAAARVRTRMQLAWQAARQDWI